MPFSLIAFSDAEVLESLPFLYDTLHFSLLFILSIFLHEFGHYLYWRIAINKEVRFVRGFNVEGRHKGDVPRHKLMNYYIAGVLAGFMVLPAFGAFYWAILWLSAYLFGCRDDFRQIGKYLKGE